MSALDVVDARLMGADCVLLIAAALDIVRARRRCTRLAIELGLDVLVEIHDETGARSWRCRSGPR